MPIYKWRRRLTRHFGEVWVPFAEIELRRSDGGYQSLALQLDSGAVISLLRRSVAELLGVPLEQGSRIELGSVAGGSIAAYRHDLEARLDDFQLRVPFAIAERENVPNLLGRFGLFDKLQVDFDGTLQETRLSAPWLSDHDRKIWEFLVEAETHVLARWRTTPLPGRADEAARRLVQRSGQLLAALSGLVKLHRGYESPLMLRAMLELSVQLEYLLLKPEERAEQYLEFEHVSRHRSMSAILDDPQGTVARLLANSPRRPAGANRVRAESERVRERFTVRDRKGKERVADNWYLMSFRVLCEQMGRLPEYNLWYKMSSSWLHADPFGVAQPALLGDRDALLVAMCYHAKVILLVAEHKRILLSSEQFECLNELGKGVF